MHEKTHKVRLWDFKWNSSHFNSHQYTFSTYFSIPMWLPLFGIYAFEVLGSYYVIQLHFALDNNEKCSLMFFWKWERDRKKTQYYLTHIQHFLSSWDIRKGYGDSVEEKKRKRASISRVITMRHNLTLYQNSAKY